MRHVLIGTVALLTACATTKPAQEGFERAYWPRAAASEYPRVVVAADGTRTVQQTLPAASVREAYQAAEAAFHHRDCQEAEARYRAILAADPAFYPALLGLGDCALIRRAPGEAIERYHEAQRINPDDFLAWFSEADARFKAGHVGEARALLTHALVLQPRRPSVLSVLHAVSDRMGASIDDEPLAPTAWFGAPQDLYVTTEHEWWVRYALCKQYRCVEPDMNKCGIRKREFMPEKTWSLATEQACLRVAAESYRQKHVEREAALERFIAADAAKLADAFVRYEIESRMDPEIVLKLAPEERKDVERYVESLVVVDRRH